MERIALCPGSFNACAGVPEQESAYAADGTEAHAALEWCLVNGRPRIETAWNFLQSPVHNWTHRADTREEREASVQTALDYINEITDAHDDAIVYFEKRVTFPSMLTQDCWGTADIIIYLPSLKWLYVIDYKHGAGKYVNATDNLQLGTYAAAAVNVLAGMGVEDVWTVVIQPRAWAPDSEVIRTDMHSASYYSGPFVEKIDGIVAAALDPNAPLVPGKTQCQFCPRRMNCPAREAAALQVASTEFRNIRDVNRISLAAPEHMSLDTMAMVMHGSKMLRDWLNDVERTAKQYLSQGTMIPGWKLVESRQRREYEGDPQDIADMLCNLTGLPLDQVYPRKLISITEAEKTVIAAFKENAGRGGKKQAATDAKRAMADLTIKKGSGRYALVPVDDPRPAINAAQANFGALAMSPADESEED
jgi:hypothetical protein